MTGVITWPDATGDVKKSWNRNNPDEVEDARRSFNALKAKGFSAFRVDAAGVQNGVMREFDPDAERIVLIPPVIGG